MMSVNSISNTSNIQRQTLKNQPSMPFGKFPVLPPIPNDTLDIQKKSNDDKKLSLAAKIGIVTAATLALGGVVIACIRRYNTMPLRKLSQEIQFKPVKSVDEGVAFLRDVLKVRSVKGFTDSKADLDTLNWVIEGMVNVSNAHKGQVRIPRSVVYGTNETFSKKIVDFKAAVKGSKLLINKSTYGNMDSILSRQVKNSKIFSVVDGKLKLNPKVSLDGSEFRIFPDEVCKNLEAKYQDFLSGRMSLQDKVKFRDTLSNVENLYFEHVAVDNIAARFKSLLPEGITLDKFKTLPMDEQVKISSELLLRGTKQLLDADFLAIVKDKELVKRLSAAGLPVNPSDISKIGYEEWYLQACEILNRQPAHLVSPHKISQFRTIYHELGHAQDLLVHTRAGATNEYNNDAARYPSKLKRWLADIEKQEIASNVSTYSKCGPGEFIAETYAGILSGNKYPKKVLDLYKSLGGPSVPNMI